MQTTDIAIVGAGASGVLLALHARRALPTARITLLDPDPQPGRGVAYATGCDAHVLNVLAGGMSLYDDAPGDFVDFLHGRDDVPGEGALADRFVPRRLFAAYLAERLGQYGADVAHLHTRVTGVDPQTGALALDTGARLKAGAVVLAVGNRPRALPVAVPDGLAGQVHGAWEYAALNALPDTADVAIIGTGLSMVDVVLGLHAKGHRGRVLALSRHALLPLPHATAGSVPLPVPVDAFAALSLRARMRLLRQAAADAAAQGVPWQWLMQGLRPHGVALWQGLSPADQARFLRHVVRAWDVHRHRIAPQVAGVLADWMASGRLVVTPARLTALTGQDGRVRLDAVQAGGVTRAWTVDRVVNATGITPALSPHAGGVMAALQAAGIVRAGPFGLGVDVTPEGFLRDADGCPQPAWFAMGSLRIGAEWESVAIPELRKQAACIAAQLAATATR